MRSPYPHAGEEAGSIRCRCRGYLKAVGGSFADHLREPHIAARFLARLRGPPDACVLIIAMVAGFRSIGPFNRAFKADSGMTPSEFRRRSLPQPTFASPAFGPNSELGQSG